MKISKFLAIAALLAVSAFPASAFSLKDGKYTSTFPGGSGTLIVSQGGKKIVYQFTGGPVRSVSINGNIMRIGHARFRVSSSTPDRITGEWNLRGYSNNHTFRRQ